MVVELLILNVVEPMACSSSTGVSPAAILVSADFWVLVWGPVGLVLATPLTVGLVVLGRHLGTLKFLDVLLGAEPVFDRPTVLYQWLIAGDYEEAIEWCGDIVSKTSLADFYADAGIPMLALAASSAQLGASAEQRHRVQRGVTQILADLQTEQPLTHIGRTLILCIGLRNELDTLSSEMLAHALVANGLSAQAVAAVAITADRIAHLPLDDVQAVVLCSFHSAPSTQAKFVCRRLRRHWPSLHITLAAWASTHEALSAESLSALGADALAATLPEVAAQLTALVAAPPAPNLVGDAVLSPTTSPDVGIRELLARTAQRAAEVFRVPLASVVWRGGSTAWWLENAGKATWTQPDGWQPTDSNSPLAAVLRRNEALVIADTARVPEFAPPFPVGGADTEANLPHDLQAAQSTTNSSDRFEGLVAVAGVPVRDKQGDLWGALALHDANVRAFAADELALLASMGDGLRAEIRDQHLATGFTAETMPRLAPDEAVLAPHSDPAAPLPLPAAA